MPETRRFFVPLQDVGKNLVLSGIEHNHLANVLRLRVGTEIIIVCGDKFDYRYTVDSINKTQTFLSFIDKSVNIHNPHKMLTVFIGLIKHDNLAFAIEKLNEIGVTNAVLFKSSYCNNISARLDKLQMIAQQSCKQCGRSIPIKVHGVLTFNELLEQIPKDSVFADEKEKSLRLQSADAIIIGPEGGFTDAERTALKRIAKSATLGSRILRAETAAIAGACILLNTKGEL